MGRDTFRVRCRLDAPILDETHALLPPVASTVNIHIDDQTGVIRNGLLAGRILPDDRRAFFRTDTGAAILAQFFSHRSIWPRPRRYQPVRNGLAKVEVKFKAYERGIAVGWVS